MAKRNPHGYGPRDWSPRKRSYPFGKKVEIQQELDRYPDFIVPAGMTGTVVMYEPDLISVKMDRKVAGAEPWDNEVHWHGDLLDEFETDVKILGGRS